MKITLIGHAAILVETAGVTVLSDPWWRGPCFGAQWWGYPFPHLDAIGDRQIDYIYLSHGHHDHLHPGTLGTLNKKAKVLVAEKTGLAPFVRSLGYEAIALGEDEAFRLGNGAMHCRILETHGGDTLMTLDDGNEVCLNLNDALHSAPRETQRRFVQRLRSMHPRIDYVFCGYGVASHFPNCYVIPGKNRELTAARRQEHFNRQWARLIADLAPRYGFPFAADVVFLEEDLLWVNEITHNHERPTDVFRKLYPGSSTEVVDIAPGFVVEDGRIAANLLRQPVSTAELRRNCAEQIERANRYAAADASAVDELVTLLRDNVETCRMYLRGHEGDYRFLIRFRNTSLGISIDKDGDQLSVTSIPVHSAAGFDLVYTTRLAYLKWALTRPFGDEILFVGSGGIFEYTRQADARRNLHREFMPLLRKHAHPLRSRFGSRPRAWSKAKRLVRRVLGRPHEDLYDLGEWTVFSSSER